MSAFSKLKDKKKQKTYQSICSQRRVSLYLSDVERRRRRKNTALVLQLLLLIFRCYASQIKRNSSLIATDNTYEFGINTSVRITSTHLSPILPYVIIQHCSAHHVFVLGCFCLFSPVLIQVVILLRSPVLCLTWRNWFKVRKDCNNLKIWLKRRFKRRWVKGFEATNEYISNSSWLIRNQLQLYRKKTDKQF